MPQGFPAPFPNLLATSGWCLVGLDGFSSIAQSTLEVLPIQPQTPLQESCVEPGEEVSWAEDSSHNWFY